MNDDGQAGSAISRREVLVLLGAAGAAMLAGYSSARSGFVRSTGGKLPACIATPTQTEGPYFVDEHLNRSDIRVDPYDGSVKAGVPLTLGLRISSISNADCTPLMGAIVDIWHCDAAGVYSDATDPNFNTTGKKFLRGYQVTDENGGVQFTTIYPGWYRGRTVHIHFKVRAKTKAGRSYEFTSQLYFNDSITDRVHTHQPYASRGERTLKNDEDSIFRDGGRLLMLSLVESGQGYAAIFDVGLQMA
jgi:protocatechuate 3,4-dioxygenase beta subunit